jgi:PAS domain S-box-containing protein
MGSTPPPPLQPTASPAPLHWTAAFALTGLAYFVVGLAALQLAIPPGYASPMFPSAGIALASVLVFGWRMAPAAALGSFAVNFTLAAERGTVSLTAIALPLLVGLGAGLQAWAGAWLVKRYQKPQLTLSEPRDIALFYALGGFAACTVSPTIAHIGLLATGTVPLHAVPLSWLVWWSGDALGVLIAAPVVLTLIGQPRAEWASRRLTVGLTLTVTALLTSLAIAHLLQLGQQRQRSAFERDASSAAARLVAQLQQPLNALEALRGVFLASDDVTREEMRRATLAWLQDGTLQAIGWSEKLRRTEIPAFEAKVRGEGLPAFRVFDRSDAPSPASDVVVAMRFIEPLQGNAGALGVNALSIAQPRAAIDAAARTGQSQATTAMRLTQSQPGDADGVVVYRAIYQGEPQTTAEREQALRGVVFVTLRPERLLAPVAAGLPPYLRLCLTESDGSAAPARRLAGAAGCETARESLVHSETVAFAGRQWQATISARPQDAPDGGGSEIWYFALAGLLATGVLGALLLTVTGRAQRIELAVRERTAALEDEVSERERTQAALRDSQQRFRNILNNVPIGVIYTDLQGSVKQANPRFCEMLGYSEIELQTLRWEEYTHPDDVDEDNRLMRQLMRGEIPMFRRRKRYIRKNRQALWVQCTVTLLRDPAGKPRRVVGVVEDISEHLRLEAAESARELAEAANRAKSDFLSRMSHELRTPLNAMLGFAQLLELDRRSPLADAQRPWVEQIQQAGWHLLEMINDVLDLSRIESGNLRLATQPLDLPDLLRACTAMVEADAKRRGIVVTMKLADGANTLLGDPTRTKQILTNLLSNAVKYNKDGGRIHIESRVLGSELAEITVTDTGLGMNAKQLGELFQPFNRLGRERSGQEGTGIGLVISKRLAELMHGSLKARSIEGEGSAFVLELPRLIDADTVPSALQDVKPTEPAYHQRIVHYVEDNETNVEVMRGVLSQRPQVRMDVSITGTEGLKAIRTSLPDLVLLDMHLPDANGIDLLHTLKADPATEHIPVVVVSADALAATIEAAVQAGAQSYLTKPVSVSELLQVVDEVLGTAQTRFG